MLRAYHEFLFPKGTVKAMPAEEAEKNPLLGGQGVPGTRQRVPFTSSSRCKLLAAAMLTLVVAGFFVKSSFFAVESTIDSLFECSTNYTQSSLRCNDVSDPVLEGTDVVAYFTSGANVSTPGSSLYSAQYREYTFYFKDEYNLALFSLDPSIYAPKYGGFCAFGLSGEDPMNTVTSLSQLYTVPASPDQFWINDGSLYMFRGVGAKDMFIEDADALIAGADSTWSSWFGDDCNGFYNTECFM